MLLKCLQHFVLYGCIQNLLSQQLKRLFQQCIGLPVLSRPYAFDNIIIQKLNNKDHLLIIDQNTYAGNFTICCFIFLLHFFIFLGFLITSNFPDFTSLNYLCLFLCLDLSLFYFLFRIFFYLKSFKCVLISSSYFFLSFFYSHVSFDPGFLQFLLGFLFTPIFHCLPLLFNPSVYFSSLFLISSGSGKLYIFINNRTYNYQFIYNQIMNKKKNCHCCDKIIILFENQLKDLKTLVNSISLSLQKPPTLPYSKGNQSSQSLLLEDLEEFKAFCTPVKTQNTIPTIGQQMALMRLKINEIENSIQILPKLKTHVSMLTKIVEYVEDKIEKMKKQKDSEKNYSQNIESRTEMKNNKFQYKSIFQSQGKNHQNLSMYLQKK